MPSHGRGTDFSIQDQYGNYRGSQVNIRLHLVFPISSLLLIGFWTYLVFTDIGAFLMGNPRSNRSTLNVGSPSSVPIRFQRYLGWFWGRKASLVRGESRGSCFVFLFKLVGLDIAWQQLWTWT